MDDLDDRQHTLFSASLIRTLPGSTPEDSDSNSKVLPDTSTSGQSRAESGTDAPTFMLNITPPDAHPDTESAQENDTLSPLSTSSCTSSSSSGHGDVFLSFQPHRHLPARPSILKQASASSLAEAREVLAERLSVRTQSSSASVRIGMSASEFGALRSRRPTSMIVPGDNKSSRTVTTRLTSSTTIAGTNRSQGGNKSEWMFEVPTPRFSREGVYTRGIVMPTRKVDYDKRSSTVPVPARPRTMESRSPASGEGPFRGEIMAQRHSVDGGMAVTGRRDGGQDVPEVRLRSISTGGNANAKIKTASGQIPPVIPMNNNVNAASKTNADMEEQPKAPKLREKRSNKSLRSARSFSNGFSLSKRWHWPGGGHDNDNEHGHSADKGSNLPVAFPSEPDVGTKLESMHGSSESVRPRARSKSSESGRDSSRKDEYAEKKNKKRRPLSGAWSLRFSRSSRVSGDHPEVQVAEPDPVPPVPPLLPTHVQKAGAHLRPRVSMSESGCTSELSCSTSMEWVSRESSTTLDVSAECVSKTVTTELSQPGLQASTSLSTSACSSESNGPGSCASSYSSSTSSSSATTNSTSGGYLTANSQNSHDGSLLVVPSPTTSLSPTASTSAQTSTSASSSVSSLAVHIQNACAFEGENDNNRGRRKIRGESEGGDEEDDLGHGSSASSMTTIPSSSPESTVRAREGVCASVDVGDPVEEKQAERKMEKQAELFKLFVEPEPGVLQPVCTPVLKEAGNPNTKSGPEERDITDFRGLIYTDSPLRELVGNAERARNEQIAELKRVNSVPASMNRDAGVSLRMGGGAVVPPIPPLSAPIATTMMSKEMTSMPAVHDRVHKKEQEKKESGTFRKAWRALTGRRER